MAEVDRAEGGGVLARAWRALRPARADQRAWVLYDCANSAFFTTVVAAVFPVYYRRVAAAGRDDVLSTYATMTSVAMLVIAVLGPALGAIADATASKKRFLAVFAGLGALATASLAAVGEGDWLLASVLFALANVGVAASFVFYDALLPSVAKDSELDRISTAGYAAGYLGGGVLLALNVAWILRPELFGLAPGTWPTRLAFVSVALWWVAFTVPLLRRVAEPRSVATSVTRARGFAVLLSLARDVPRYPHAFLLLLAMLVYGDGINTIIRMAVVYGGEIGIDDGQMILAILLVQFLGVPCALLFGWLASRIGAKRAILVGLSLYVGITLFAAGMRTSRDFYALAAGVAIVQGGTQALSRSLFASLVPVARAGEFFGVFGVLERFSNVLGPLVFAIVAESTGNARLGIVPLVAFFVVGAAILARVDVEAGKRAAREPGEPVRGD